jgi:flagellar motor switch protein FliM
MMEKAANASAEELGKGSDFEQLFGMFRRQRSKIYRDQVQSLEQFHDNFARLIRKWFTDTGTLQQRLVIFVDDLGGGAGNPLSL